MKRKVAPKRGKGKPKLVGTTTRQSLRLVKKIKTPKLNVSKTRDLNLTKTLVVKVVRMSVGKRSVTQVAVAEPPIGKRTPAKSAMVTKGGVGLGFTTPIRRSCRVLLNNTKKMKGMADRARRLVVEIDQLITV